MKHIVTRTYEVEVLGLYMDESNDPSEQIMDAKVLEEYCKENDWSWTNLILAATRYADVGNLQSKLYLSEIKYNDGQTAVDWTSPNDMDQGGKILCGPVWVQAKEIDEKVDT
jgi:hypothetical protein